MSQTANPSEYPAHYPLGGTFADFLCWHMDYWGTRSKGSTTVNGKPWGWTEFRREAFPRSWEEESNRVGLGQWRGVGYRPLAPALAAIKKALFGGNPIFQRWSEDLDDAWRRSKGKGNNIRTKEFPHPPPIQTTTASIPRLTPHFMGRDAERDGLVKAILSKDDKRNAFLIQGGPGMGKTELAKSIARHVRIVEHFGERRWFVPLETATTAEQMQVAIIHALGGDPQFGIQPQLRFLGEKPSLIVLDNLETPWEHLEQREAAEDVFSALAEIDCVTLLASIRGTQHVGGANWYPHPIPCLSDASTVALFSEIAGGWVRGDPHLANFVSALGGLPLAIDLIARRAEQPLSALWEEWLSVGTKLAQDQYYAEIFDDQSGTQIRNKSLPISIELSLRSPRVRWQPALELFALLGCLPDGISYVDCKAILGSCAFNARERLYNVGLAVKRFERIDLLPPIREYARRCCPPDKQAKSDVVEYYLGITNALADGIDGVRDAEIVNRFLADLNNIKSSFTYALDSNTTDLVRSSTRNFCRLCNHIDVPLSLLHDLTKMLELGDEEQTAGHCCNAIGTAHLKKGAVPLAQFNFTQALQRFENTEDLLGYAEALKGLGIVYQKYGNYDFALQHLHDAMVAFERCDNLHNTREQQGDCLLSMSSIKNDEGKHDEAETLVERARKIFASRNNLMGEAKSLLGLAHISEFQGNDIRAQTLYERSIDLFLSLDGEYNAAHAMIMLSTCHADAGRMEEAFHRINQALPLFVKNRDSLSEADCLLRKGVLFLRSRTLDHASDTFVRSLTIYKNIGNILGQGWCLLNLADIAARQSNLQAASNLIDDASEKFGIIGNPRGTASCNDIKAWICALDGQFDLANYYAQKAKKQFLDLRRFDEADKMNLFLSQLSE